MHAQLISHFQSVLAKVTLDMAERYREAGKTLQEQVDHALAARDDIDALIGHCPRQVMYDNHACHQQFMSSVFVLKDVAGFIRIIGWVYRSYPMRGFSLDYFPVELAAWRDAVLAKLGTEYGQPIAEVYQAMIDHHEQFVALSESINDQVQVEPAFQSYFEQYLQSLLAPSAAEAVSLVDQHITQPQQVGPWWEHVITPVMHEIGRLWEQGHVTVGQEHVATSITHRVLASKYPLILQGATACCGRAVVSASPGEEHELGARMVADLMELAGWDVQFAGANTPIDSLARLVQGHQARVLCISTTMPFNLPYVKPAIEEVRRQCGRSVKIYIGGQAYQSHDATWRAFGADAKVDTIAELTALLDQIRTDA